jgi:hypothetical protein
MGVMLATVASSGASGKASALKQRALPGRDAGNVLLVHLRDDLERARLADPEENFTRIRDLPNFALLAQDDAVERRAQDIRLEPRLLCRDQRLDPCLLALGPLEFLLGADVAGGEVAEPCRGRASQSSRGQRVREVPPAARVVETRQHVACCDAAALAVAELDDPLADEGRHLSPGARLDDARGIDDLCRVAPEPLRRPSPRRSRREKIGAGRPSRAPRAG